MSPHSNLTHDTSSVVVPFAQSKATDGDQDNVSVVWIYIYTLGKQKVDEHAR